MNINMYTDSLFMVEESSLSLSLFNFSLFNSSEDSLHLIFIDTFKNFN